MNIRQEDCLAWHAEWMRRPLYKREQFPSIMPCLRCPRQFDWLGIKNQLKMHDDCLHCDNRRKYSPARRDNYKRRIIAAIWIDDCMEDLSQPMQINCGWCVSSHSTNDVISLTFDGHRHTSSRFECYLQRCSSASSHPIARRWIRGDFRMLICTTDYR